MDENVASLDEHKSKEQLKRELTALKRENIAAMKTIDKLLKDLNKKAEEITHLQSLVAQTVPVVVPEKSKVQVTVTPEEEIAHLQLEKLRQAAQTRTLTLEEIRAFDLLVKNKRLSQDESTVNLSKSTYRDVTDVELIKLASSEVPSSDDNNE